MTERALSSTELQTLADISPVERRTLVRTGVLSPARTGGGWAVFTERDLRAARAYRTANPKRSTRPKKTAQ